MESTVRHFNWTPTKRQVYKSGNVKVSITRRHFGDTPQYSALSMIGKDSNGLWIPIMTHGHATKFEALRALKAEIIKAGGYKLA
jgi:hypothetical protein